MPSVTETIVPTLRASVTDLKPSIRCLMRSLISVALMAIYLVLIQIRSSGQLVCDALEARAQAAVDYQVPGANHRTADERAIRRRVQTHFAFQFTGQRFRKSALLPIRERRGGCHRNI